MNPNQPINPMNPMNSGAPMPPYAPMPQAAGSGESLLATVFPSLALVLTALSAGIFLAYAVAVMPGLSHVDDATFVSAFGAIDRAIVGPLYLLVVFFGAPAAILVGALVSRSSARSLPLWIAFGLAVVAVIVTLAVNVPLNDALKAASAHADPHVVRQAFHETRWAVANVIRTLFDLGAVVALVIAVRR